MTILYILIAIAVLLIMVVIHEFGHYVAGKLLKFKINEFSVGFGPKLLQRKNKKTGEIFSLRLIPLGGYCAFAGEGDDDESAVKETEPIKVFGEEEDIVTDKAPAQPPPPSADAGLKNFNDQKPWKRIIVLLSGAFFNLVSAVVFSFLFILIVGYARPVVSYALVDESGKPYNALITGDEIIAVDGRNISVMDSFETLSADKESVTLTILRRGAKINIVVNKYDIIEQNYTDENGVVQVMEAYRGFGILRGTNYVKVGVGYSFKYMFPLMGQMSISVLQALWMLITGKIGLESLTGPIGTVETIVQYTQMNWRNLLALLPLIAANLGIFNLLPIPALDGSKIVFTVIEWIRGKPINRKVENMIHSIGMIVLLLLVVLLDIVGLFLRR